MKWKKLGILISPSKDIDWMASHVGPSFATEENKVIKIFITGRDINNVSRIGTAYVTITSEEIKVVEISKQPLFDIGEPGTFDESGVSYPWLIEREGIIYMYYVGWVNGGLPRFQNFTGLAISDDGGKSFHRNSRVPILDRTPEEPIGSGSCCVFIEEAEWKMYYTSFDKFEMTEPRPKPFYNIKFATSTDGINWNRKGKIIIDYHHDLEHIIGKPMLIKQDSHYQLWYSWRGKSYRIGYAESENGIDYKRKDQQAGIDVSKDGWDSEMIEYAFVFDHKGNRYMLYNGNQFGKTGLGIAILEQ